MASQHLQMGLNPYVYISWYQRTPFRSNPLLHPHILSAFILIHSEPSNISCNLLGVQPWYKQITNCNKTLAVNKSVKGCKVGEPKQWSWVLHSEYTPPTWYCRFFQSLRGLDHLPSVICEVYFYLVVVVSICK